MSRRLADPQVVGAVGSLIGHGRASALTGAQLLPLVRALGVECDHLRRIGEAVAFLVASGEEIASCSRGYYRPETVEEFDVGARTLGKALAGLARRYRTYDRTTADRILELLGQQTLGRAA